MEVGLSIFGAQVRELEARQWLHTYMVYTAVSYCLHLLLGLPFLIRHGQKCPTRPPPSLQPPSPPLPLVVVLLALQLLPPVPVCCCVWAPFHRA